MQLHTKYRGNFLKHLLSLGLLFTLFSTSANAAPPTVSLLVNNATPTTGTLLTLTRTMTAGVPAANKDIYVALGLPDGTLLVMQPNGSFGPAVTAVQSNVPVSNMTSQIFSYTFIGSEQVGRYTWYAGFATPGTMNFNGSITSTSFFFNPNPTPILSIANAAVAEGSTLGTTNLNFTVTLSAASTSAVTVDYATTDGTALASIRNFFGFFLKDYTATAATLTIAAGATTGTITVLVNADTTLEPNETLTLTLSNPTGATIATAVATGTIINDDWRYTSRQGIAMINAGFVYVPGGWDVNGDGSIESGFWISKYQASAIAGGAATIKPNLIDYLAGTATFAYVDGMQVYNPVTKQFDQTLCTDGTDLAPGVTPAGCRHNNYIKLGNAGIAVNLVKFVNNAVPLVSESAVEAMAAVANSQVVGGLAISLPSELQWMQLVQLLINNPASWSNGVVNSGGGTLWRGNSNGPSALAANNLGATDTTENATFDVNRRTWLLTNGVMANDPTVPANYCAAANADGSADGSLESVDAATEAKCTVWDMAGNVWQWTRGLIAANAATSSTGRRAGGDRFIDGMSLSQEYSNVTLQANAPAWWLPTLSGGTVLTSTQNAGRYYDGTSQTGAWDDIDLGYGAGGRFSGFTAVSRGGDWMFGADAGLAAAFLEGGPGYLVSDIGFRAASL